MGMFDYLRCIYPLPVDGTNGLQFQTKDTPEQCLDQYEIRKDGTLWHETYDIEDRSDPNADGLSAPIGMMTKVNERWEPVNLTGDIRFYGFPTGYHNDGGWIEFSAYFVEGKIQQLHVIDNSRPIELDD